MKKKIRNILLSTFMITTMAVSMTGCGSDTEAEAKGDGEWPDKIVLVQMPNENNPNAGTRHEEFSKALSDYIGIEVSELEGTEYSVGIEAMASGNIDVMLVSPMSYYQAKERAGAELLVSTPIGESYYTAFITKSDRDDINSLKDLKGKSFAFVDQASSSGYMYPKAKLLMELDLDSSLLENSDYFFNTVAFSGNHATSVQGVVMGDYDAAAVGYGSLQQMADAGVIELDDIKVIGKTDTIPNPSYVVRGDLPNDLKAKIKDFFLTYDNETYFEEIHGGKDIRFNDVKEEDYAIVYDTLEILGIDGE